MDKKYGLLFIRKGEFKIIEYTDDEIGILYPSLD